MNESVELEGLEPIRNSLILIGLRFRTFSAVVSGCNLALVWVRPRGVRAPPEKGLGGAYQINISFSGH